MPEKQIASTMNTAALIALIGAGVFYIFSILSAARRLGSKKRKTSKAGIMFLVLATLFAVSAMMLHMGFSWWIIAIIIIADCVLAMLLTDG